MQIIKKRYAVVGVSNRAYSMFMDEMLTTYNQYTDFVAMLDKEKARMVNYNRSRKINIPMYLPEDFERMLQETKPDTIIVACQDGLHHEYVLKALEKDLDVIVEKPLTIDEKKCAAIYKSSLKSKGKVKVTFNLRYMPAASKIRELISQGKIGKIVNVHLDWYLDTFHGASYFGRWNRYRNVSGGLNVHKSCHHFDLVRWWIGQVPIEIFAYGGRIFYGPNGVHNPLKKNQIGDGRTCLNCDMRTECKYYMRWYRDEYRSGVSAISPKEPATTYENYCNRQCIFDPDIDIEDTYSALIKYDNGAILNYSFNASTPYEGCKIGINGTLGRLEYSEINSASRLPFPPTNAELNPAVTYIPMFGARETIDVLNAGGGHGGGDPLIRDDLFIGEDKFFSIDRKAGLEEGIEAVLTGVALHKSIFTHNIISIKDMWLNIKD